MAEDSRRYDQRRVTHCILGHRMTPDNVIHGPRRVICKQCKHLAYRRRLTRQRKDGHDEGSTDGT
jgi:hypothetical protein